jgi:hypothetical protein
VQIGELDALVDLVDRPVGQVDRYIAVATFVRIGRLQLKQSFIKAVSGVDHVGLEGIGRAGACEAEAGRGSDARDRQTKLSDPHDVSSLLGG